MARSTRVKIIGTFMVVKQRVLIQLFMSALVILATLYFTIAESFTSENSFAKAPVPSSGEYRVLEINGVINPLSARYLLREIKAAQHDGVAALILKLNTPGGLDSSMRDMTQAILSSQVPVVTYVSPVGARAASAGMFIVISSHIAAMAPDTTIGAAHPVRLGAGSETQPQGDDSKHLEDKIVNDAAAFARALAQRWGRNATWIEQAVRQSVSITAAEALQLKVIDVVAEGVEPLVKALDGREIRLEGNRTVRLAAPQASEPYVVHSMTFAEEILHTITDPNIAYLLMSVGILGITIELYSPGLLVPGVIGVLSLLLAFISLGSLPISWAGLVLLGIAAIMLALEVLIQGFGMLGVGSIVAFLLGSLFLYRPVGPVSPSLPEVHVSPWLIAVTTTMLAGLLFGVMRAVVRSQRGEIASGPQALVGKKGVAQSALDPEGFVRVDSEQWSARLDPQSGETFLGSGVPIEVTEVRGVTLLVREAG